jgi:hypothetical protein
VVGALSAQPDGEREPLVEVLDVWLAGVDRGDGRHLVDDRVGAGGSDGLASGRRVQAVHDDGPGAEPLEQGGPVLAGNGRGHLVAAGHELGDEPAAEHSAAACDEHALFDHLSAVWVDVTRDEPARPAVTPGRPGVRRRAARPRLGRD